MLYVFHVDVGRMMSFDMTVALSSVENLKNTIERLHGISASNIVLLVSGGEMLTHCTQVSCYSAGTDTNPIYMFLSGDAKLPTAISQHAEPDLDLKKHIDRCLELPAVYDTVVKRAQTASRMYDLARDEERLCERLVHEQHLQQQGWSAVVANMEDVTDEFRRRFRNFFATFERHLEQRSKYLELLRNFSADLSQLARIPILPGLMQLAKQDFHGFDDFLNTDEVFSRSLPQQESVLMAMGTEGLTSTHTAASEEQDDETKFDGDNTSTAPNKKQNITNEDQFLASTASTTSYARRSNLNLLQWITSKENHNTLKLMSDECIQGLNTFNDAVNEKLKVEVLSIVKMAEQTDVKEIKGISERLCRLEEFKYRIKNMVQDQKELSTAFQQNQSRAINLRDPSILPDLCASHQSQLLVMQNNHDKIRELRRLIANAKDELGGNLHMRLKRIVWVENAMSEIDNRLLFYHRCLRRAEKHITIIEQIHQAPCIYVAAITEVIRRKIFCGEFGLWASKLVEDFEVIYNEEIERRQTFNNRFEGHFLNTLFPGMSDMPPPFLNANPQLFDTRLPNITKSDIDILSMHLPELTANIHLTDMGPVINFFVSRSGGHQRKRIEELMERQLDGEATLSNSSDGGPEDDTVNSEKPIKHRRLNELQCRADESETNTEPEFEKVLVAMSNSESDAINAPLTQNVATLTDESESAARSEVAVLRCKLAMLSQLSVDCIRMVRINLANVRADTVSCHDAFHAELQVLREKCRAAVLLGEERDRDLQKSHVERSHELQLLRDFVQQQNIELQTLRAHLSATEAQQSKCASLETQIDELHDQLLKHAPAEQNMEAVKAREQLIHDHKTEIESLRCRVKLVTSIDVHSHSSVALDIDSDDVNKLDEAAAKEAQVQPSAQEKQAVVRAAIEIERSTWQSKAFPTNSITTNMLEDKDSQLYQLREKDVILTTENHQLKTRLDALTNEEANSWLKDKMEYLYRDNTRLEEELNMEKSRRIVMESSLRDSTYEQPTAVVLPRSRTNGSSQKYIVLDCCAKGDMVFVVWSTRHGQFMVVQDSPHMYFVHSDSLAALNLRLPTTPGLGNMTGTLVDKDEIPVPMPYYAIGRVIEKEYCQARKDENRYRVTRGSKFYRIKLTPLSTKVQARRDRLESFSTSVSHSLSQSESQTDVVTNAQAALRQSTLTASLALTKIPSKADSGGEGTTTSAITMSSTEPIRVMPGQRISNCIVTGSKKRTKSITIVTEEDDEPISLLSERCRYISVSEEEEPHNAIAPVEPSSVSSLPLSKILQQSVIKEQPMMLSTLKRDLLLAAADIPQQQTDDNLSFESGKTTAAVEGSSIGVPTTSSSGVAFIVPIQYAAAGACSPLKPTSVGTTSEESDEYRSLEAKDDTDFPIPK